MFIQNFYAKNTIVNVSAIVGTNGVGKTLILKEITNLFASRHDPKSVVIFENNDEMIVHNTGYDKKIITQIEYRQQTIESQTIYYYPFLDFKE